MIRFGSACSGIEAASVAWEPLGWGAAWFSEIEAFPSGVLAHRWPAVANLGDMTTLPDMIRAGAVEAPDVFVAGTPCQAFSVAGKRASMGDDRGQLSLTYIEIVDAIDEKRGKGDECVAVWENVPGVLSTSDNAFGCFIGALAGNDSPVEPGPKPDPGKSSAYWRGVKGGGEPVAKWPLRGVVVGPRRTVAWRVLDAQYFGVAQRRRRVFVVASARDGFDPAAVLFESEGVRRDTPPSREAGQGFAADVAPSPTASGRGVERVGETRGQDPVVAGFRMAAFGEYSDDGTASTMKARDYKDATDLAVCQSVTGEIARTLNTANNGKGCSEDGTGRGVPTIAIQNGPGVAAEGDPTHALDQGSQRAVAFQGCLTPGLPPCVRVHGVEGCAPTLSSEGGRGYGVPTIALQTSVTPKACEELAYTLTLPSASGGGQPAAAMTPDLSVRRLPPVECERLQGFPDNHTQIPWRGKSAEECPDGPRYEAIGNSKAVPVVRWLGRRLERELLTCRTIADNLAGTDNRTGAGRWPAD